MDFWTLFLVVCKIIAISMMLFKWMPGLIVDYLKKHHLISIVYCLLGSIGLFSVIFSVGGK